MKLKKCPFCGNPAFLIQHKNKLWAIGCTNMGCFAWACNDENCTTCTDGYVQKEIAIKEWNTRT